MPRIIIYTLSLSKLNIVLIQRVVRQMHELIFQGRFRMTTRDIFLRGEADKALLEQEDF